MGEIGQFFLEMLSIAVAAAVFVVSLVIFFERVMPRIPGKSRGDAMSAKIDHPKIRSWSL